MNLNQTYTEYFAELDELLVKYNIDNGLKTKIINEIYLGLPENEFKQIEFYDYLAKIIASNTSKDPIFSKIAAVYQVKIYNEEIGTNYLNLVYEQYSLGLISEKFYNYVTANKDVLVEMLDWERDKLIDYFGLKTLERSYLLKHINKKFIERPQMMWLRVGIQIHGLWEGEIDNKSRLELIKSTYDLMSQLYFTHATPTLFNSGSNYPQLSSCYLLQCPDDLEQIGDSFKSIMMISKWAGGIGINLSDIRSNNSLIKSNGGRTNGIIPLCKVLESLARYVNQSSKRLGSIACFLEVFHADIEDFIQLRKNTGDDNLRARDLFLGLWVCDMFMKAVETDGDWYLMNPSDCVCLTDTWGAEFETLYARYVLEGKYIKKVKARELYKKITECQFETGMPYMMFKDTINARSNQQNLGTIKNSNLCVAPETQILTDKGYFKIVDLKDKKVNVWNGEKFSEIMVRQTGVKQKLIKINFSNYESIECTPYHKFYVHKTKCKTEIIEASKLQPGMKLVKYNLPVINIETELKYPYTCGLFSADGTYENCGLEVKRGEFKAIENKLCNRHNQYFNCQSNKNCVDIHNNDDEQCIAISNIPKPRLSLYGEKKKLIDYIECRNDLEICKGVKSDTVILNTDIADKYFVPINYSVETKLKWLAGLSDGDGCLSVNQDNKSIQISSIHLDFLKNIRLMLTTLGINPKITTLKEEGQTLLPDGKGTNKLYDRKKCYRLLITSNHLYKLNELGFKTNILDNKCNKPQREAMTLISIKNVEDLGRYDDTYCFNEPEKHSGIFNGILTSNCSEIVEYSSPDEIAVCNLASVSLPKFVSTKLDGTKYFDFETFGKVIQLMVLNLNNVIDMNYYPVPQTAKSNLAHRPIGIGVQGLADCYYLLGYSFDSPEATKLNKQIFECAYWHGLKSSNDLAKTRGKYSTFDGSPFSKGKLQFHLAGYTTEQVADKELGLDWVGLVKSIMEFGTRNSLITTIMPTASTAQILNNNESIEPYASNIYVRKVLAGEYMIVNKHLVHDFKKYNLWNDEIIGELLYDNGSVQKLSIPQELKNKYKTAYELKQSVIVKQAIDRGLFIDQSQSMNLFMENPDHNKLASAHIYAWKNGLKTGSYYIRTKPITEATKFSIDIEQINLIKSKRIDNSNNKKTYNNKTYNSNYETCETCSA